MTNSRRNQKCPIDTWVEQREANRRYFGPSYYHRDLHQKLQTLTQGNNNVEDYFKEMKITMISIDVQEDQEATMLRFLNGLRPEITEVVQLQYYIEIGDMVHKAVKVEWCPKKRGTTGSNFNFQPTDWRTA